MKLYNTVKNEAHREQNIERSRFISHIKPVETKEEAEEYIYQIRSQYKDATHNVPAMVIGDKMQLQWATDDGEPQGTSGAPIVQLLVKNGLTNVVVVVTRYFGGVKLGTGGLVRAYTSSAKLAVDEAGICEALEACVLCYKVEYSLLERIKSLQKENDFLVENISYADTVTLDIVTDEENGDNVLELLGNITKGNGLLKKREKQIRKI